MTFKRILKDIYAIELLENNISIPYLRFYLRAKLFVWDIVHIYNQSSICFLTHKIAIKNIKIKNRYCYSANPVGKAV